MRNIEIGGYIRISKKEAEKRYNTGEIIRLCACKVSPVNVWGVYVDCQKEEFPHIGNDGFNTIVNAFRRYNCNYEIGYYPAYYVKAV